VKLNGQPPKKHGQKHSTTTANSSFALVAFCIPLHASSIVGLFFFFKKKKNKIAPDIAAPQPAVVYIVWAEHKKPTRTIQNTKRRAEHNNLFLGSNNTVVR
jgi:hypothetical protein